MYVKLYLKYFLSQDDNRKRKTKHTIEMAKRNHDIDQKILKINQDLGVNICSI